MSQAKVVYVVVLETGSYDEYTSDVMGVFISKNSAEKYIQEYQECQERLYKERLDILEHTRKFIKENPKPIKYVSSSDSGIQLKNKNFTEQNIKWYSDVMDLQIKYAESKGYAIPTAYIVHVFPPSQDHVLSIQEFELTS